jgi:murein hydrolase activator
MLEKNMKSNINPAFSSNKSVGIFFYCALIFLCCALIFLSFNANAQPNKTQQEKQQLEKQRAKLLQDIDLSKKLLQKTEQSKKQTLHQLEILQKQIATRQQVISTIMREINILTADINEKQAVVNALENDLKELKKRYAEMVVNAYKNRTALNEIVFVFSAQNFNDAYQRVKLIQTLNQFRKKQAELIVATRLSLNHNIESLKEQKTARLKLLNIEVEQKTELNEEKQEQNNIANELKKKEKQLLATIKQKQADADKLSKKIEEIIKKEIEAAKKKAEAAAAKSGTKPAPVKSGSSSLNYTPEAAKLSSEFAANQGKLPWPVEKGIISKGFGQQPHPVLKGILINNNGIDIKTERGATARALFEGVVTTIITVPGPGNQKAVMVRHGEFFTVYSNLAEVFVKAGQKITLKQNIGKVYTNEDEGRTELHLEIWKDVQKMNPANWIMR